MQRLTGHDEDPYLGLTQAADGAAAITATGWMPPANAAEEIAAVVRSWQQRFGAGCAPSASTRSGWPWRGHPRPLTTPSVSRRNNFWWD